MLEHRVCVLKMLEHFKDSSRQALQTNGKLFSILVIIFRINYNFKNKSGVGFMQARKVRHLC